MYIVYQLTDEEKDKIVRYRFDEDTHYYDYRNNGKRKTYNI